MNTQEQRSWGLTVLRIAVATIFLVHGGQKLFVLGFHGVAGFFAQVGIPAPGLSAVVVTLVEFLGGLALLLGIGTRWASVLIAIEMLGAIVFVHAKHGFFVPNGIEFVFTLMAANIALALAGPGALALDNFLGRKNAGVVTPFRRVA